MHLHGDINQSGELLIYRTDKLPNKQENTVTIPVGLDGLYRHSKVNSHYLALEEEFNDRETLAVSTIGEWQERKSLVVETQILGLPLYQYFGQLLDDNEK